MSSRPLFRLGQSLTGRMARYKITSQISDFVYLAENPSKQAVVVKSVRGHWRLHNERDVLERFQSCAPTLRPLLDEIHIPADPPAIVLKYFDDDATRASRKHRLTRREIKQLAKSVLEALNVLHEAELVHTDIKPSNILVNYRSDQARFSSTALADLGGVVSSLSQFATDGVLTGTGLFRAPEVHLELPWGTASDIWSFGITLIYLLWGYEFHIFGPEEPENDSFYNTRIVVNQHRWFGPFPKSYNDFLTEDGQQGLIGIMSFVSEGQMVGGFAYLKEREICAVDKKFLLKILKLDPRDRPTAKALIQDEWFKDDSDRRYGWYSLEEWCATKEN